MKGEQLVQSMRSMGVGVKRIQEFVSAHAKQPDLWKAFEEAMMLELLEADKSGRRYISVKSAWERMRKILERGDKKYAANNNLHSLYARAFVAKYPVYRSVLEFRELKESE